MLDPKDLYHIELSPWLDVLGKQVVLIHLFDGYIDAGSVTHTTGKYILEQCDAEPMVIFDHDQVHDYRSRRPQFTFDTDKWVAMHDYELLIYKVKDAYGKPFLLMTGPEPDTQWNRVAAAVMQICERLGVRNLYTASGVPMAVPHTRPTLVTEHSTDPGNVGGNPVWIDRVQIPGSFSHMLEYIAGESGLTAGGFLAHVPHYLSQGPFPPAIAEVLARINGAADLDIPLGPILESAEEMRKSIDQEAAEDTEFPKILAALEEQYDEMRKSGAVSVPSAEEIGATVERFLAEQDGPENKGLPPLKP
ncbi:MAG: PAC2 family protein [Propionibacteriaceae bacterium]|nr:PAC2 family protein [Propionibacteriaceae bacterium]